MRILPALLAALLCAAPLHARTLDMPDDATVSLLRSYLANTPPDFATMARQSSVVRQASEFDRAAVLAAETDRLRQDYTSMRDVDGIVLRLSDGLGEYDANAGGFPLRTFGPDIYVPLGGTKIVFDNYRDFANWELSVADAREVLSKVDRWSRSVRLELTVRPFAVSRERDRAIRTQVRSVRILSPDGHILGEMSTEATEEQIQRAGGATASFIPDQQLDMLGLTVGTSYAGFSEWVAENGFVSDTIDAPTEYLSTLAFSARANGLPAPFSRIDPFRDFMPLQIAGSAFDCRSALDKEKLCGSVTFSREPALEAKHVLSMRMVQNVIGMTPEQVVAKLGEKYGPHTDAFDVYVSAESNHRARQYVWGAPFPLDDDRSGAATFTRQNSNWQVEAVVFEPEMNRTVLLLQLIGARGGGEAVAGASDVRL